MKKLGLIFCLAMAITFQLQTPNGPFGFGQIDKIIVDPKGDVAVQYFQGYMDGETFKSAGGAAVFSFKGQDFTDYMNAQGTGALTTETQIVNHLRTKGMIK